MIPYIGDFAEDATIYHYFNTFDSNDPSASVTATDLADTDLFVYKDGSVTDLVTDGASVVIDFDGRTGAHKVTIDTSAHVDYATGSDYMVLMNGVTVDGGTINAALFTFSIENRTTFPKADYPTNFAAMGIESDGDLTKVNTLDGHTAQTGDSFARIGANGSSLTDLSTAAELAKVPKSDGSASWNATALAAINAEADTALTDYDAPTKAEMDAGLAALNDLSAAQVNAEVDTALADYDPPTKAELDSGLAALNDPTTADILAKIRAKIELISSVGPWEALKRPSSLRNADKIHR